MSTRRFKVPLRPVGRLFVNRQIFSGVTGPYHGTPRYRTSQALFRANNGQVIATDRWCVAIPPEKPKEPVGTVWELNDGKLAAIIQGGRWLLCKEGAWAAGPPLGQVPEGST